MAKRIQSTQEPEQPAGTIVVDGPVLPRPQRSITLTDKQIGRSSRHWCQLQSLSTETSSTMRSYRLPALGGPAATQVRRDVMTIGVTGSPARGSKSGRRLYRGVLGEPPGKKGHRLRGTHYGPREVVR